MACSIVAYHMDVNKHNRFVVEFFHYYEVALSSARQRSKMATKIQFVADCKLKQEHTETEN